MTSVRKAEANRRNAQKSTGPRTPEGKARASRNALRHGVLVAAPVIREMERAEEWDSHLSGLRASLAPVGYLEEVLADRAALLLWRMGRVARFERDSITAGVEAVGRDAADERGLFLGGTNQRTLETRLERATRAERTFARTSKGQEDEKVDREDAEALVAYLEEDYYAAAASDEDSEDEDPPAVHIPGVPDGDERDEFDAWTVGLLLGAVAAYGKATGRTPEGTASAAWGSAYRQKAEAEKALRDHREMVARRRAERLLPDEKVMDRVLRYETTMERAFLRTLHELQRLQASRAGGSVPPPLALDVTISPSTLRDVEP